MRGRDDELTPGKSQTFGYRKIPLALLLMLQFRSGPVSERGRNLVIFSCHWRKDLLFDRLWPTFNGWRWFRQPQNLITSLSLCHLLTHGPFSKIFKLRVWTFLDWSSNWESERFFDWSFIIDHMAEDQVKLGWDALQSIMKISRIKENKQEMCSCQNVCIYEFLITAIYLDPQKCVKI